jgi:hypothetical protein
MVPEISERASRPLISEKSPEVRKKVIKQKAKYSIYKIRQLEEIESRGSIEKIKGAKMTPMIHKEPVSASLRSITSPQRLCSAPLTYSGPTWQ